MLYHKFCGLFRIFITKYLAQIPAWTSKTCAGQTLTKSTAEFIVVYKAYGLSWLIEAKTTFKKPFRLQGSEEIVDQCVQHI